MTKTTPALFASVAALALLGSDGFPETITIEPYDLARETVVTLAFVRFLDGVEPTEEKAAEWNGLDGEDRVDRIEALLAEFEAAPATIADIVPTELLLADRSKPAEPSRPEPEPAPKAPAKGAGKEKAEKPKKTTKAKAATLELTHVVMRTSRYLGSDGRSVARNRIARTTSTRAEQLIAAGEARPATAAALAAAGDSIAELA